MQEQQIQVTIWNCNLTEPVNRIGHAARGKAMSNVEDASENRNLQFVNQTTPSQYSQLQWSLSALLKNYGSLQSADSNAFQEGSLSKKVGIIHLLSLNCKKKN